uniref:SCP domain-containing protein n=2 Tax=Nemorhina TaxID=44051 RepID=A0A1B0AT12_9MUSC
NNNNNNKNDSSKNIKCNNNKSDNTTRRATPPQQHHQSAHIASRHCANCSTCSHTHRLPHIACQNHGNFDTGCGRKPHLLYMSERRRNLILDLHNLARSRIATGQVTGYKSASHMPQLKWENELAYLAVLHAKRCKFAHGQCHNTQRFHYSRQNIGYY